MKNNNHQELSKLVTPWLQALRGGVQGKLHQPHIAVAEKAAVDALVKYIQLVAAELLLAAGEEAQ